MQTIESVNAVPSNMNVQLSNTTPNLISYERFCVVLDRNDVLKYFLNRHKTKYKCEICTEELLSEDQLRQHLRIHDGEKPYKCELCDQGFNSENSLEVHMMRYTNEEPLECHVCSELFSNEYRLKEHHLKLHSYISNLPNCISENKLVLNKNFKEVKDSENLGDHSAFVNEDVNDVKVEELELDECNLQDIKQESLQDNWDDPQDSKELLNFCQNNKNFKEVKDSENLGDHSAFVNEDVNDVKVEELELDECNLQDIKQESLQDNWDDPQDSKELLNFCQNNSEKSDNSIDSYNTIKMGEPSTPKKEIATSISDAEFDTFEMGIPLTPKKENASSNYNAEFDIEDGIKKSPVKSALNVGSQESISKKRERGSSDSESSSGSANSSYSNSEGDLKQQSVNEECKKELIAGSNSNSGSNSDSGQGIISHKTASSIRNLPLPKSLDSTLKQHFEDEKGFKKVDRKSLTLPQFSEDTELYLMQIPKSLNPNLLINQQISLNNKTKIDIDGHKYEFSMSQNKINPFALLTSSGSNQLCIKKCLLQGNIKVERDIKVKTQEHKCGTSNDSKVELPPNIKERHAIFGVNYRPKLELDDFVKNKLNEAVEEFNKQLKHKEVKKHKKPAEDKPKEEMMIATRNPPKSPTEKDKKKIDLEVALNTSLEKSTKKLKKLDDSKNTETQKKLKDNIDKTHTVSSIKNVNFNETPSFSDAIDNKKKKHTRDQEIPQSVEASPKKKKVEKSIMKNNSSSKNLPYTITREKYDENLNEKEKKRRKRNRTMSEETETSPKKKKADNSSSSSKSSLNTMCQKGFDEILHKKGEKKHKTNFYPDGSTGIKVKNNKSINGSDAGHIKSSKEESDSSGIIDEIMQSVSHDLGIESSKEEPDSSDIIDQIMQSVASDLGIKKKKIIQ